MASKRREAPINYERIIKDVYKKQEIPAEDREKILRGLQQVDSKVTIMHYFLNLKKDEFLEIVLQGHRSGLIDLRVEDIDTQALLDNLAGRLPVPVPHLGGYKGRTEGQKDGSKRIRS